MIKHNSEVDIAHEILKQAGQPMYFRDLITKVLEACGRAVYSKAHAMAEVHTQINMDSRFVHQGKGMWGLLEWTPQSGNSRSTAAAQEEAAAATESVSRRAKLFEEIQQHYVEQEEQETELE